MRHDISTDDRRDPPRVPRRRHIALHCIALHCIGLDCIAFTLHCIALHCIALHCMYITGEICCAYNDDGTCDYTGATDCRRVDLETAWRTRISTQSAAPASSRISPLDHHSESLRRDRSAGLATYKHHYIDPFAAVLAACVVAARCCLLALP